MVINYMRPVRYFFTSLTFALFFVSATAQEVVIPDPGLDAAIRGTLQKPTGPLTEQDLLGLTHLDAPNRNIKAIDGLEGAVNLISLGLERNGLTNFALPPQLTNLVTLDLSFNALVHCVIPSEATNLTSISLGDNRLTDLNLPGTLSSLVNLNLDDNGLASFNLSSNLTSLMVFDIGFNSLTQLTIPSGMTNLAILIASGNQLTNFNVPDDMTGLTQLELHINQLSSFDLPQSVSGLTNLDLSENELASFGLPEGLTNLATLDLSFNLLTNLNLPSDLTGLVGLDMEFNQLSSLNLPSSLTNLQELELRSNQLTNFALPAGPTALASFDIGENQLKELTLPAGLSQMTTMRISGNTNLASLTLPAGMTSLKQIYLRYNQLTNLTLPADLNSLATIDALGNQLPSLNLPSGLTNLTELALSGNLLTTLTLPADMSQLNWLVLNGNPLNTIVLPEPLATNALFYTVAALQNQGVLIYTYPLTIQLIRSRQLIGAFQFAITGPPGVYSISASVDLTNWSDLQIVSNALGAVVVTDGDAHLTTSRFYRASPLTIPANMVYVQPNTFLMGSPTNEVGRASDESPQTTVTLSHGFWVSQFPVTQREYLEVVGSNPSGFPGDLSRPVESVTWLDATNYCARLTQREIDAGRIPRSSRYRLPTEAEWECSVRAGSSTRFYYGDDPGAVALVNHAWYGAIGGATTHPVGQKEPNAWGLYDMEGDVWEWCQDWYSPYLGGMQTDPQGPASNLTGLKVIRGGAWESFDSDCRSARRMTKAASPFISDFIIGFRVVLTSDR